MQPFKLHKHFYSERADSKDYLAISYNPSELVSQSGLTCSVINM